MSRFGDHCVDYLPIYWFSAILLAMIILAVLGH